MVRAIAVTTAERSQMIPDVPTYSEAGVKGVELASVWGVMAPARTPDDIVNKLNLAINKAIAAPDTKKKILDTGAQLLSGSPADMDKRYTADRNMLAPIVKNAGMSLE